MDALVDRLVETLYFAKEGPNKFNQVTMTWKDWILWPYRKFAG